MTRSLVASPAMPPRSHSMVFLLMPSLVLNGVIFLTPGWSYQGLYGTSLAAVFERAAGDVSNALARTSLAHLRSVTEPDDHVLREIRRIAAADPGNTLVICAYSPTSWRKVAYYFPDLPVLVLDRSRPVAPADLVAALWRGPKVVHRSQGPAPLETPVPTSKRIIWLVTPGSEFFRMLSAALPLIPSGPVYTWDRPQAKGSARAGGHVLIWQDHR